ncbi:MAG: hypothetical protein KGJ62_02210 [Armatimonadetes bacterium]|nr:hypothetical protein [Armatimonadota bacterium]MDE2205365.1 hypothetical protein [Armatimonadota bacterium]
MQHPSHSRRSAAAAYDSDRHALYHAFLALVGEPGCSVCARVDAASSGRLRQLFAEEVCDTAVRTALRSSWGFCARHAQRASDLGAALGVALIYQDIAAAIQRQLAIRRTAHRLRVEPCTECLAEDADTVRLCAGLGAALADEALRERYALGGGLCGRHLAAVFNAAAEPARSFLSVDESARLSRLEAELGEYVRKCDFNHSSEPMGPERSAWRRALAKISGASLPAS